MGLSVQRPDESESAAQLSKQLIHRRSSVSFTNDAKLPVRLSG